MTVAVNEISKHPKIVSEPKEIVYIEDKRKNEVKSIVIPARFESLLHDALKEIEYRIWLERNRGLLDSEHPEILENVVGDVGEKL